jgi:hypothetical protein
MESGEQGKFDGEASRSRGSVRRRSIAANRAVAGGVIDALAQAWQRDGDAQRRGGTTQGRRLLGHADEVAAQLI